MQDLQNCKESTLVDTDNTLPRRISEAARNKFRAELLEQCGEYEAAHMFRIIAHQAECGV